MLDKKTVAVAGLGTSGEAAADLLRGQGAVVKVTDNADNPQIQERARLLREKGIDCEIGAHTKEFLEHSELLVVSPGVDNKALPIKWAEERGLPIISEIELGCRFCKGTIVAVSGTNGKSTAVSLIGEMLKKSGKNAFVCGNIGTPFTSLAAAVNSQDIVVLEVSSFQLERITEFKPRIAVLLNITEDHLDRYADFDEYARAKFRLFMNQRNSDYAIINYEEKSFKDLRDSINSNILYFTKRGLPKGRDGAYVENNELVIRKENRYVWIATKDSLSLNGEHNLSNGLAAALAGFLLGVEPDNIKDVLCNFKGLDHRFELVDTVGGVRFVDDSKATNIDSARRAILSSPKGIMLIAGGRDKGGDYKVLTKLLKEKVKSVFLIGEAKERIASNFSNTVPTIFSSDLREAVRAAFERARRGDTVLLSPMCSSFDMFRDYKERGEVFRRAVKDLKSDA